MSDTPISKSWLGRLSDLLLREPQDVKQLVDLLRDAKQRELIDGDTLNMIESLLKYREMTVDDVMVPRSRMTVIEHDATLEQILPLIIESAHSRFPVIGETRDEILGILLAKDLLRYMLPEYKTSFNLRERLRTAIFVPESKRLDVLLREFRNSRNHMAIVVNEYGGISGLVTIEDVLEEIVGDIVDEFDRESEDGFIKHIKDQRYVLSGLTSIEAFNQYFNTHFSTEEYDTMGGLLMQEFGHLPKMNETVCINQFSFKIIKADQRRIHTIQVSVRPLSATASEDDH